MVHIFTLLLRAQNGAGVDMSGENLTFLSHWKLENCCTFEQVTLVLFKV